MRILTVQVRRPLANSLKQQLLKVERCISGIAWYVQSIALLKDTSVNLSPILDYYSIEVSSCKCLDENVQSNKLTRKKESLAKGQLEEHL